MVAFNSPDALSPHTTHTSTPAKEDPAVAARCWAKPGGDLRLPPTTGLLLVSAAEATIWPGEDEERSVGGGEEPLEEARFRAPLESILMAEEAGDDLRLGGGDDFFGLVLLLLKVGVMEMIGAVAAVEGMVPPRGDLLLLMDLLDRIAAAAALTAAALEESWSSLSLACHSRA